MHALPQRAVSVPPVLHSSLGEWGMIDYREQVATRDSVSYFLTKFYITLFTADPKKRQGISKREKNGPCLSQERWQKKLESSPKKPDPPGS